MTQPPQPQVQEDATKTPCVVMSLNAMEPLISLPISEAEVHPSGSLVELPPGVSFRQHLLNGLNEAIRLVKEDIQDGAAKA